jgi:hypothetical protein
MNIRLRKNNYLMKIFLLIVLVVIILKTVHAIGIAPASRNVVFEAGYSESFSGLIVNSGPDEIIVELFEEDDYGILEVLEAGTFNVPANSEIPYNYVISFAEKLPKNGSIAYIVVREEASSGMVGTSIQVASTIIVEGESEFIESNIEEQVVEDEAVAEENIMDRSEGEEDIRENNAENMEKIIENETGKNEEDGFEIIEEKIELELESPEKNQLFLITASIIGGIILLLLIAGLLIRQFYFNEDDDDLDF